jgi:hypothetical protein
MSLEPDWLCGGCPHGEKEKDSLVHLNSLEKEKMLLSCKEKLNNIRYSVKTGSRWYGKVFIFAYPECRSFLDEIQKIEKEIFEFRKLSIENGFSFEELNTSEEEVNGFSKRWCKKVLKRKFLRLRYASRDWLSWSGEGYNYEECRFNLDELNILEGWKYLGYSETPPKKGFFEKIFG